MELGVVSLMQYTVSFKTRQGFKKSPFRVQFLITFIDGFLKTVGQNTNMSLLHNLLNTSQQHLSGPDVSSWSIAHFFLFSLQATTYR